jgi:hypothetical protein
MKLLGIISVGFDVTDQLQIRSYTFTDFSRNTRTWNEVFRVFLVRGKNVSVRTFAINH